MRRAFFALILLTALSSVASADPITITFEESDPRAAALAGGLRIGGTCPGSADPIFQGCSVRIRPHGAAGNNALFPNTFSPPTVFNAINGRFIMPTAFGDIQLATSFLAFDIVGSSLAQNPFYTVNIYDPNGIVIGSETGTTDRRVTFSLSSPTIGYFAFLPGGSEQGIDNLTFEPSAVPEPATLVLLGTGLAGIAAKVRRRRGMY